MLRLGLLLTVVALLLGIAAAPRAGRPLEFQPARGVSGERPLALSAPEVALWLAAQEPLVSVAYASSQRPGVYALGRHQLPLASVAKVLLMLALLEDAGAAGQTLDAGVLADLEAMIGYSDNDVTEWYWWDYGGPAGLAPLFDRLGVEDVALPETQLWGDTAASAAGLVQLLRRVISGDVLTMANQEVALDLMERVTPSQRWGALGVLDARSDLIVGGKNGWWPGDDDEGWWIASIAFARSPDRRTWQALAVIVYGAATMDDGIALVETASAGILDRLGF